MSLMQLRHSSYFTVISNALPCGAENWRIEKIVVYRLGILKIRRLGLISRKPTETSSVFPADYNVKLSRHQIPGGGVLPSNTNEDVPLNGVAFSWLHWLIIGLYFHMRYLNSWVAHFRDLGGQKIQVGRDFNTLREDFYFNKCVNVLQSSRMT